MGRPCLQHRASGVDAIRRRVALHLEPVGAWVRVSEFDQFCRRFSGAEAQAVFSRQVVGSQRRSEMTGRLGSVTTALDRDSGEAIGFDTLVGRP